MPCFDAVASKMARNQRASGFLLCSKIVPGDHRDLPAAVAALVDYPLRRQKIRGATRAVGAAEALRPFQPSEVLSAVVFIGEPTAELCLAARKFGYVHPTPQTSFAFTLCSQTSF